MGFRPDFLHTLEQVDECVWVGVCVRYLLLALNSFVGEIESRLLEYLMIVQWQHVSLGHAQTLERERLRL